MRRSRVQSQHVKSCSSHKRKLRTVTQKNRRLVRRLSCVKKDLAKMQEKNAAIKTETLEKHITCLPPRQRDAVRQCFATAKVKKCGQRYTKNWILECVIMKMKSPRLYEHLRKNNILSLPSKATLKRYMTSLPHVFWL